MLRFVTPIPARRLSVRAMLTQLYYNALVPMSTTSHRGRSMKYGVISMKHLTEDLEDWTWLYTAGRYVGNSFSCQPYLVTGCALPSTSQNRNIARVYGHITYSVRPVISVPTTRHTSV